MTWQPETFEVANGWGASKVAGYTYRGLGLYMMFPSSPKGRRPATWCLAHLGSGHRVVLLRGDVRTAFPVATEIAEAGDWDFLSLEGWKDRFPDAIERLSEIVAAHPKIATGGGGGGSSHEIACQIASNRP